MQILNQLETEFQSRKAKTVTRAELLVGILCALLLGGTFLGGYLWLVRLHARQIAAIELGNQKTVPKVEVFVDDTIIDGKKATLGGTLHNISKETLRGIAVELQLRRRTGGGIETRAVVPELTELAPDGKTRYSLEVQVQDYVSSTFLRVLSGEKAVQFKALPGAARPPMETPASKTTIVNRPAPKGEEFINSPNNPGRVP